jgi:hypothetical protein
MLNGFRVIGVWPLNPRAMDDKTKPSSLYTTKENKNHVDEDIGNLDDA